MTITWNGVGEIALRTIISIVVLFLLSKILGARQISQMSFYDYVHGITIGSIAATMAIDDTIPILSSVVAMIIYAAFTLATSILTNKSIKIRKFFTGVPKVLIDNGKIIEKNMSKTHIDVCELTSAGRNQGYFNLGDIQFAIMEPNGNISFLPYGQVTQITLEDMNLAPKNVVMSANVVIDGNIMYNALFSIGKDENWLNSQLKAQKVKTVKDVLLAVADSTGEINIYLKDQPLKKNYFM